VRVETKKRWKEIKKRKREKIEGGGRLMEVERD